MEKNNEIMRTVKQLYKFKEHVKKSDKCYLFKINLIIHTLQSRSHRGKQFCVMSPFQEVDDCARATGK